MLSFFKKYYHIFEKPLHNTIKDDGPQYAGYLSFLLLLSIFPFLFFFTAIAGYFANIIGESSYNITKRLTFFFIDNVPENIIEGIMPYINEILDGPTQSLLTFTILGAIWTASSMIEGIKAILNKAYNFDNHNSFYFYLFGRFISIIEFLMISLVILMFFIAPKIIPSIQQKFAIIEGLKIFPQFFHNLLTTLLFFLFISTLYMFLPKKKQSFFSVIPGSAMFVFLWVIASNLFSFYIKSFAQVSLIYGSIAGIIIILLFFYIINLCFIYGAEMNAYIKNDVNKDA
jgi:membrane protein